MAWSGAESKSSRNVLFKSIFHLDFQIEGWYLLPPAYSSDFNPVELAFAKLKVHLRQAAARLLNDLHSSLSIALARFRLNTVEASFITIPILLSK